MDSNVIVPKIILAIYGVREIVQGPAAKTVEMIIATLQRTKLWQKTQMPLANQRRAVASFLQERGQRRVFWGKPDIEVSAQGLFQPEPQPILVAAGDQRRARGGAHKGIRVSLQKTQSLCGDPVDTWGAKIRASVTGHVGIAEIVRENEDDVGRPCRWSRASSAGAHSQPDHPGCGSAQKLTSRDVFTCKHHGTSSTLNAGCRRCERPTSPWRLCRTEHQAVHAAAHVPEVGLVAARELRNGAPGVPNLTKSLTHRSPVHIAIPEVHPLVSIFLPLEVLQMHLRDA